MHLSLSRLARPGTLQPRRAAALFAATFLCAAQPVQAQTASANCPAPNATEVEGTARAYFNAFNKGDKAALDALLDPDYRHQGAVVVAQDRALHLDRLSAVRQAFPDGVYTIDWLIVDGDQVAVRHTFRGTHRGEYSGVPASGRPVAVGAFHVHRIACGRIAETWNAGDALGLFRQISAIPGPVTTPADEEPRAPASPARTPCPATTPEQNEAAARRWYDEVLNQGRFEVLDQLLAENIVHHAALFVDLNGREETAGSLRAIRTGFPDIRFEVNGVVASGDKVLIRWTGRGTHKGQFLGVPASGASVDWSGMNAFRFACGRIVEGWSEANGRAILRQIGGLP
jgi:steroid delta-isomerase-like uncharacterized protein